MARGDLPAGSARGAQTEPVALPVQHAASSRLAWRIAKAIMSSDRRWSLDNLSVTRRWQFRVGRASWIAEASVGFFFEKHAPRGAGAVFGIHFKGRGSVSELEKSALFQSIVQQFDSPTRAHALGPGAVRVVRGETRPQVLLAEVDRIAGAFGSNERHRASTRSTSNSKRLVAIGEALIAHGTWTIETPSLVQTVDSPPASFVSASVMPTPSGARGRAVLHSMLYVADGIGSRARVARAESRGYVDRAGGPDRALMKEQPLSLRAALTEARLLAELVA